MKGFQELFQMKKLKRFLTLVLAVAMLVTAIPTNAFAAEVNLEQTTTEGTETTVSANAILTADFGEDFSKEKEYTGNVIDEWELSELKNYVKVKVGEKELEKDVYSPYLALRWVTKDNAGVPVDMEEAPVNAGTYSLYAKMYPCDVWDGEQYVAVKESEAEVATFVITPAKITVTPSMRDVPAGTKVKDIKVPGATASIGGFGYVVDDPNTADIDESQNSDFKITVTTVKEAASNTPLEAEAELLSNGDYVLDFEVSFTEEGTKKANGNYVLGEVASQKVTMEGMIDSFINVTPGDAWKETKVFTKTYDGQEVNVPDFTAKVQYEKDTDEEGNPVYEDITGASYTEEGWFVLTADRIFTDSEGNDATDWTWEKLEGAPTEVGRYVYRLSYEGQSGLYKAATADIDVVIEPAKVVIKPVLKKADEEVVFYDEMTEEEVLAQIDYQVYSPADMSKAIEVDRTTVWGTSYDDTNETQAYEPVFVLEYALKNDKGEVIGEYSDNEGADLDSSTKAYRVIFKGTKAVYNAAGEKQNEIGINDIIETTALNYNVETDPANAVQNALALTVTAGTATKIDISAILEGLGGKGDSLLNPYMKVYDGNALYVVNDDTNPKALYKKAVVTDAEGKAVIKDTDDAEVKDAHAALEYRWYKNKNTSITNYIFSSKNEPYGEKDENLFDSKENWELYKIDELSEELAGYEIPNESGVYKLVITYQDPSNPQYRTSKANVYYVIEKQPIRVGIDGDLKVYTGQSIPEFLENLYNRDVAQIQMLTEIDYKGYSVSENSISGNSWIPMDNTGVLGENWKINYTVYKTEFKEKKDEEGNKVRVPVTTEVGHSCNGKWEPAYDDKGNIITKNREELCNYYEDCFEENTTYTLTAYISGYNDYNYTNNKIEINSYRTKTDNKFEIHKVRETKTWEDRKTITVEKMGETELRIVVDSKKLGETQKVYDGKPFDIVALLKDAVTVEKKNVKYGTYEPVEPATDVELEYLWDMNQWNDDSKIYVYERDYNLSDAVNAGKYTLKARFVGDDTYQAVDWTEITEAEITPATVTAKVTAPQEDVVAGTSSDPVWKNPTFQKNNITFEGVADADKGAFTYNDDYTGYLAFTLPYYYDDEEYEWVKINVTDYGYVPFVVDGEFTNANLLKGEKEYTLRVEDSLEGLYHNNYDLMYEEVSFKTVRGTSRVHELPGSPELKHEYLTNEVVERTTEVKVADSIEGFTHTIKPLNAIPYSYYMDGNRVYGNFLEVQIDVPKEYTDEDDEDVLSNAFYENAISAVDGVVKKVSCGDSGHSDRALKVILEAPSPEQEDKTIAFDIRWEEGYVETFIFDFEDAEFMGNLAEAVAPKSIAFNSPATKMVVGEEQSLDLKLTKVQFNDVICISYEVSDETVLSVDEQGRVTALKVGKATVTATPVKVENGKKVAIEGAKVAKVNITVSNVPAPKTKKVIAYDTYAEVQYSTIASKDGYRREIYVLEGKNIKPADFEAKIAQMSNGQWDGIFADEPQFLEYDGEWFVYNEKTKKVDTSTRYIWIDDLNYNTDYTVYVRNVSGVRKAGNGNNVELSYAGTTKSFKTTKAQVWGLYASLNNTTKLADRYEEDRDYDLYQVALADGKPSMSVRGFFDAKEFDALADKGNAKGFDLPLNADAKKIYVEPKLSYAVYEREWVYDTEESEWNLEFVSTKLATVDKKGNVKLNGVGTVFVEVKDQTTGVSDCVELQITAAADKVTGNKVKLSVGQYVYLEDTLTYYEGSKKLIGDYDRQVIIDEKLRDEFNKENSAFVLEENGAVTAVKAGGKLEAELTDAYVLANEGAATAKVTFTSTALEPVKNLKIANAKNLHLSKAAVADTYGIVQFTYAGGAEAFKIEVKDQRGRLIRSSYVTKDYLERNDYAYYYDEDEEEGYWYLRYIDDDDYIKGMDGKEYYTWKVDGLTQQSKYTVEITARYDDLSAKMAKTSIKTTKVPASTFRLCSDVNCNEHYYDWDNWGNEYEYPTIAEVNDVTTYYSGNKYTLEVCRGSEADLTGSDSLIWSSSNPKVATIKANPGSFTANFKALRAGYTIIEVKSKLTKEVIAREYIFVKPVGDAYSNGRRYFDENTPSGFPSFNPANGKYQKIAVEGNSEKWISYTAEKEGIYRFYKSSGSNNISLTVYTSKNTPSKSANCVDLSAKQTVYIKLKNTGNSTQSANVSMQYVRQLSKYDSQLGVTVPNDEYVYTSVTVSENGIYQVIADGARSCTVSVYDKPDYGTAIASGSSEMFVELEKGETYYLKIKGNADSNAKAFKVYLSAYYPMTLKMDKALNVTAEKDAYKWITFTAPETSEYTFAMKTDSEKSKGNASVSVYKDIKGTVRYGGISDSAPYTRILEADETVYIKVVANNDSINTDLTVSKLQVTEPGKDITVDLVKDEVQKLFFRAEEAGYYRFDVTGKEGVNSSIALEKKERSSLNSASGTVKYTLIYEAEEGENICINVQSDADIAGFKVSLSKYSPKLLETDKALNVTADEGAYEWVEFTAPETNEYTFVMKTDSEKSKGSASGYVCQNTKTTSTQGSFYDSASYTCSMQADETIYIKVVANGGNINTNLTVTKVTELIPGKVVTTKLEQNKAQKYIFRPEATDYYRFEVTGKKDVQSTITLKNASGTTLATASGSANYYLLHKAWAGNNIYVYVNSDADIEEVKVSVTKNVPKKLEVGKELNIKVENGKYEWVKFTAPETNTYTFELKDNSETSTGYSYGYIYKTYESYYGDFDRSYDMSVGDTIYIKVNASSGDIDTTLTVSKIPTLIPGKEVTVDLKQYDGQEYPFHVAQDGYYRIDVTGREDVYSYISLCDAEGDNVSSYGYAKYDMVFKAKAKETIFVYAYSYNDIDNFKLALTKYIPMQLEMDKALNVKAEKATYEWVEFTAPETNNYTFTTKKNSETAEGSSNVSVYENMTSSWPLGSINDSTSYTKIMQAGDTVYIKVSNDERDVDLNLSVSKASELELGKEVTADLKKSGTQNYIFRVEEAGYYRFDVTGKEGSTSNIYLYDTEGCHICDSWGQSKYATSCFADAGEKIYVKIWNNNVSEEIKGLKLSVSKVLVSQMEKDKDVEVKLETEGDVQFLEYEVKQRGAYAVTVKGKADNDGYANVRILFGENGSGDSAEPTIANDSTATYNRMLDPGEKIYIEASYSNKPIKLTFNVTKQDIQEFTESKAAVPAEGKEWFVVTIPETSFYEFSTSYAGSEDVGNQIDYYVVNEYGDLERNGDYSYFNSPLSLLRYMEAGQKLYFRVDYTKENPITLKMKNVAKVEFTESKPAVPTAENEWFVVTIPETSFYEFSASYEGTEEVENHIDYYSLDEDGYLNQDGFNSDSGRPWKSDMWYLEAGQKLYFRVDYTEATKITLNMKNIAKVEFTENKPAVPTAENEWFAVTIPETSYYSFSASYEGTEEVENYIYYYSLDEDGYLNEDYFDSDSNRPWKSDGWYLEAGQKLYFRVNYTEVNPITLKMKNLVKEALQINLDQGMDVNLQRGEVQFFKFTAPEEGEYCFYSVREQDGTGDTIGYLYEMNALDSPIESGDDENGNNQFKFYYTLDAGQSVLLLVKEYYGNSKLICTVYVTQE